MPHSLDMLRRLWPLLLVSLLDTIGFMLMVVLLSYLAKEHFALSAGVVGLLLGFKQLVLMAAGPIIGGLADRWGRRPLLLFSLGGTIASHLVIAFAGGPILLFIGRLLDGASGGNYSMFQTVALDRTVGEERPRALGWLGATFGLGALLGALAGIALSLNPVPVAAAMAALSIPGAHPHTAGFLLAAGLSTLAAITSFALIPETRPEALPRRAVASAIGNPLPLFVSGQNRGLYAMTFLFFVALFSIDMLLVLFAIERFGLSEGAAFGLLAMAGLVQIVVQGAAIGPLVARIGTPRLLFGGFLLLAASLAGWALAPSVTALALVVFAFSLAVAILNPLLRAEVGRATPVGTVGGAMGNVAALSGLARLLVPVTGGLLLELWTGLPGLLAAAIALAGALLVLRLHRPSAVPPATAGQPLTPRGLHP